MSTHLTLDALDVTLDLVGPHTYVDGDMPPVPAGKAGLIIRSGDDTVLVVGTPEVLRGLVEDGLNLPVPAGVPLYDD